MKALKANAEDSSQGRVGRGIEVSGEVRFTGVLQIDGRVTGKLISRSGTLIIEQTGQVNADVEVGACVIRGAVTGNLNIHSRVEVSRTGRIQGDIKTPILTVEEGALLTGNVLMGDESMQTQEPPSDTTERLRKSQMAP
jgi:cytoskeletal protein CcmA (bactofilin family)